MYVPVVTTVTLVVAWFEKPITGRLGRTGPEPSSSGRMTGAISLAVQGTDDGHDRGTPVIK